MLTGTAVPNAVRDAFTDEPRHVDLRGDRNEYPAWRDRVDAHKKVTLATEMNSLRAGAVDE